MKLAQKLTKAIAKSSSTSVQSDDVPVELLMDSQLDLHRWTMIVSDSTLKRISTRPACRFNFVDTTAADIKTMFARFEELKECPEGVVSLDISGAKTVTEFGLGAVARKNRNLKIINISGCAKIRDVGIRELGASCSKLTTLIMPGCHSIDGSGFIAVAECCKLLKKIDISKCKGLQSFGIVKVFYDCNKLEDVNVSYLNTVGDEELRVLAQNCPNIITLEARECPYISDQGVLAISQHCADLDLLDVSRSQMQFRITDVSLLALGQRSSSLRVLKLNGCDQVSDVGLNWLAEGCQVIEELDIGGCTKVSDAGLRSLGTHCHSLISIDISNLKLVSDIGITSLCSGCPKLRTLVCPGLFFLADPRLSAPAKGEKLEAWQAVVGIAAIEKYCPLLEHLNLAGCFRLDKAIRLHIAGLKRLRVLNLQGCYEVSVEALLNVAKNCVFIEELILSDCGAAVNNASVSAFAENCKNMRIVTVARCEQVRGSALRSISNCALLEKLDLTGCKNITDIMMLPLTEADKVPRLRNLILTGLIRVTDSMIAWFATKEHNIHLLAVRGTSITRHGLNSMQDYFPFCDVLENDNFMGYWPKQRVDDRKLLNGYHALTMGITAFQARVRGIAGRKFVAQMADSRKRSLAIFIMQRTIRQFIAKCRLRILQKEIIRRERAAITITSVMRIPVAKAELARRKAIRLEQVRNACAVLLQTRWRIVMAIGKLNKLRIEWDRYCNRRHFASICIQALARRFFARVYTSQIRRMRAAREALMQRKVVEIQRVFRGLLGRKRTLHILKAKKHRFLLCVRSANLIRKAYRSSCLRRNLEDRVYRKVTRNAASIKIQALMRGYLARDYLSYEAVLQAAEAKLAAIIMLQKRWRIKAAVLLRKKLEFERHQLNIRKNIAAISLQKLWRGKLGRRIYYAMLEKHLEKLRQLAFWEIQSAIKIQSLFRGNKGRARYRELIKEKKGKWKELFDEGKQKRFFYNKLTGEIRWRMPQDLLDLIPRPHCDNCSFYEAKVECYLCNEVFCEQCFGQVHYGGRRKDHEFRTLYDYYDKRIDYGDGDFPCKWPSEVIQDEIQGWMLRVAPLRDPVSKVGDWEQYAEIDADGSTGRTFFFNRLTFEASYDEPQEVSALVARTNTAGSLAASAYFDQSLGTGYYDESGQWVVPVASQPGTANGSYDHYGSYDGTNGSPGYYLDNTAYGNSYNNTDNWNVDPFSPAATGIYNYDQTAASQSEDAYQIDGGNPMDTNRPLSVPTLSDPIRAFDKSFQYNASPSRPTLAGILEAKLGKPKAAGTDGPKRGRKSRNESMIQSGKLIPKRQLTMKIKPQATL